MAQDRVDLEEQLEYSIGLIDLIDLMIDRHVPPPKETERNGDEPQ